MVLMQGYQGSERGLWLVGNSRKKRRKRRRGKKKRRKKRRRKRRHLYLRKKRYVQKSVSAFRTVYRPK